MQAFFFYTLHGACRLVACKFVFRCGGWTTESEASGSVAGHFFYRNNSQPHALLYLLEKGICVLKKLEECRQSSTPDNRPHEKFGGAALHSLRNRPFRARDG
jgi:hypothetical protein